MAVPRPAFGAVDVTVVCQQPLYLCLLCRFTLISAYLVFFMHCGFAMVGTQCVSSSAFGRSVGTVVTSCALQISIGCVRQKFAKHIAILILLDACASALGFYLFG